MKSRTYLLNAIRDFEPKFIKAWEEAIAQVASEVSVNELTQYLKDGNVLAAIALVETAPEQFVLVEDAIREAYRTGFDATQGAIPKILREGNQVVMRLSPRNMRAEAWLAKHSSTLIKDITDSTRDAIRAHLTNGVQNGINPRKVALDLLGKRGRDGKRSGGLIGLTRNQMQSVLSYREALQNRDYNNALNRALRNKRYDSILSSGKKLTPAQIDTMVESYKQNYTKHRATVIAEQETRVAMSQARREVFTQTLEKGYLKEQEIKRYWITRRDSRVRDDHSRIPGMNSDGVTFNQPFNTPDGPVMDAPHGIGCRCYVDIRLKLE